MTKQKIQAVRGMRDLLPEATPLWAGVEAAIREVLISYGYRELRPPLLESTDLFSRSIGEVTDIVEKEMYTFPDRSGDSLTLRPEATAGMVRACIEHGLLHNQTQRLWCTGPMFRYEKRQRERYRQFHQVDVEVFGMTGPDIDAELIAMSARLWRRLGIEDVELQLNSLGSTEARLGYRQRLVEYFSAHQSLLDEDSQRRLHSNPLRILDSKNPDMAELIAGAPLLVEHLDTESQDHFEQLQSLLDGIGIGYRINPRLVRGLDYYNRTVFEWVTTRLGTQGTICGGGRYDGLVAQLSGQSVPGIGFAIGVERLVALLTERGFQGQDQQPQVYFVAVGEQAERQALLLAERLRDQLPGLRLQLNCNGGGFKAQFKRADRSGAHYALILGDDEVTTEQIAIKPLRGNGEQHDVSWSELAEQLGRQLGSL